MNYIQGHTILITLIGNTCLVAGVFLLVFYPTLKRSEKARDRKMIRGFRERLSSMNGSGPFSNPN
jgi:hypothetical protein